MPGDLDLVQFPSVIELEFILFSWRSGTAATAGPRSARAWPGAGPVKATGLAAGRDRDLPLSHGFPGIAGTSDPLPAGSGPVEDCVQAKPDQRQVAQGEFCRAFLAPGAFRYRACRIRFARYRSGQGDGHAGGA